MTDSEKPKAILVLTVEAEHLEYLVTTVRDRLKADYDDGVVEEQVTGPVHATVDPEDVEMILDVFRQPWPGKGTHVLQVDNERWHLEHSLRCRRAGLENCPITSLVSVGMEQPVWSVGRHDLELDERGALLWGEGL